MKSFVIEHRFPFLYSPFCKRIEICGFEKWIKSGILCIAIGVNFALNSTPNNNTPLTEHEKI